MWDTILVHAHTAPGLGPIPYSDSDDSVNVAREASTALPLVDFAAVAMVHHIRDDLLDSNENECLQRLIITSNKH